MNNVQLFNGDCLEVMKTMEPNSFDSIVTDPPYGLSFMGKHWDHGVPGVAFWEAALRVAKPGAFLLAFGGTRTFHRLAVAIEDAGWEVKDVLTWLHGQGFPKGKSQLKPAWEPIIMARKPLIGTVAANVQAWGCGGLNIDQCRIPTDDNLNGGAYSSSVDGMSQNKVFGKYYKKPGEYMQPQGRWPANLLLDPEASALLDEMSGTLHTHAGTYRREKPHGRAGHVYGAYEQAEAGTVVSKGDSGGASRFFARVAHDEDDAPLRFKYQSKASKRDRDEGLEGMEEQDRTARMVASEWKVDARHPDGGYATAPQAKARNHHPTVKPTALMQWLVRLVTPPGGTVLDCFAGSGSTGKAAVLEGFHFIGIELDEEYLAIAEKRIQHAQGKAAQPPAHMPQLPLLEMTGD